jgi:hypothetical protein
LLHVGDDELDDSAGKKVGEATDSQQGAGFRERHWVELSDEGEDAGNDHQREFDVVVEEVL